jgi:serine/threonine-protein kinase
MKSPLNVPKPGEILAGKYVVERTLGEGGMGFVLAAMHRHLDQRVAIKCLLPELADDPEIVTRFLREGQAATKIRSEHVVRVLDVGTLDSGAPFLVMEYLEGRDLAHLLEAGGPLPIQRAIDYVLQALEAIAEAHALGMVHRDLKPANLFESHRADGTPVIKVLDFGISKVTTPGGMNAAVTRTQTTMGSPQYMPPEQMRSTRDVDARADIWAFGIVLFELIAGVPAFKGQSMAELCAQILQDPTPSLVELRLGVSAGLDRVVQRCLEKDPKRRYANVGELAIALAEFASTEGRVRHEDRACAGGAGFRSEHFIVSRHRRLGRPPSAYVDSVVGPRSNDETQAQHGHPRRGARRRPWLDRRVLAVAEALGLCTAGARGLGGWSRGERGRSPRVECRGA